MLAAFQRVDRDAALRIAGSAAVAAVALRALRVLRALADPKHAAARLPREACHVETPEPHPLFSRDFHVNGQGLRLFVTRWPAAGAAKGTVVLSHGLAEHCGRYARLAERLALAGYAVVGHDHQGHGRSEGTRGHVERFAHYVDDLAALVRREADARKPVFLLGHSMGAQVAVHVAGRLAGDVRGVVLSAPATVPAPEFATPLMRALARVLGDVLPKLQLAALPSNYLCHDAGVVDQYLNDPLVYLGGIRARWGAEFLAAMRAGFRVARARTDAGLLVIHGGDLCQKQNIHDTFNMVDGERI